MPSGTGRGRCASDAALCSAPGCECSARGAECEERGERAVLDVLEVLGEPEESDVRPPTGGPAAAAGAPGDSGPPGAAVFPDAPAASDAPDASDDPDDPDEPHEPDEPEGFPEDFPDVLPAAGGSAPERLCAGKAEAVPGTRAGAGVCTSAPPGSAGVPPGWGRSKEVGCSVTRVESVRPALCALRALRPAEIPIPGKHLPGTGSACGQRMVLCRRPTVPGPYRCCCRTPRSRPAAPR
ncbi:hypothetical protein GCM10009601_39840 [Streptomyces thermospinosisporus]|uniref:Uncharacterized protein n=1 Tax=Streptomyces thermospinosisporus TaxID=161482 RepID=A0ABP4JUP3_9ACTN